ncbi:MAG: hypothetical protein KBE23_13965 [Chloroflexi bacterium]|nr:hypothetical protein [Chloroflexota bacterium]MBP7043847.1 hypothetical protein [Chloroflexota bacterium]
MKKALVLCLLLCSTIAGIACGGQTASGGQTAVNPATAVPIAQPAPIEPAPVVENAAANTGCEEYFRFCTHVQISGSVTADFTSGIGGNVPSCAEWAASGAARHLDLPMVQAFEQTPTVIVALTALGEYTGPGQYVMQHTKTSALPDMFPSLAVGDRTFERGEGVTAVAEVAADGSGTFTATGLIEVASLQNSNPDPNAQVDLTVTWTCQEP